MYCFSRLQLSWARVDFLNLKVVDVVLVETILQRIRRRTQTISAVKYYFHVVLIVFCELGVRLLILDFDHFWELKDQETRAGENCESKIPSIRGVSMGETMT